jgi:integrase
MTTEAGLFIELMDDPMLDTIDVEMILEYAQRLALLPHNIYQAKRQHKVSSLQALIRIAEDKQLARKTQQTITGHIRRVREIMNFAARTNLMSFNPAADYKRRGGRSNLGRAQDEREVFDPEQLTQIFSQDWYKTGRGEPVARPSDWTVWRPFHYWLPLLGLLTGGRLNELSQLYLDDIKRTPEGTWYIDFNIEQPDKVDDPDKSLKTANSLRVVPTHRVLVSLGLPTYVESLRNAGAQRLFPELTRNHIKGYGKPAGSWFNEKFLGRRLGIPRDGKKSFHSLRHGFITALERQDTPGRTIAQLAGHERGSSQSATRYAKDRGANMLFAIVDALDFDFLHSVAPFDIDAGHVSLEVARRRKSDLQRARLQRAAATTSI